MSEASLLLIAFVFLTAAVVVVPLAQRLGFGAVLGYLLAGVVIGPFGFSLIGDSHAVMSFAEFGVVLMLFLIGLEIHPATLWRMRRSIVGLGASQVLLSSLALAAFLTFAGFSLPVVLVGALALSLSSTAIVLQMLQDRKLTHSTVGQSTFSVLLLQDLAVIPILALLPLLALLPHSSPSLPSLETVLESSAGETLEPTFWLTSVKTIGIVSFLVLVGHFGLRHLFHYIALTRLEELFTATVLLVVVGVTLMMEMAGLSAALGAFTAGVVLAESEYRHEIERELRPFKSLLLGLFFISVGMSIDFSVAAREGSLLALLVVGLVVLKFLVCLGIGRLARMPLIQAFPFSLLLAQGGEFAFVIFSLARQIRVLDADTTSLLTAAVGFSMALAPLLYLIFERVLARRILHLSLPAFQPIEHPAPGAVMIAGYGRFGQILERLLRAQDVPTLILDNDPEHIQTAARLGVKVFYGDIANPETLRLSGIGYTRLVVMAINEREKMVTATRLIKSFYPSLPVLVRAHDRRHVYELKQAGADFFVRETHHSALAMGEQMLKFLGFKDEIARQVILRFAEHEEKTLQGGFNLYGNEQELLAFIRHAEDELVHATHTPPPPPPSPPTSSAS